MRDSTWQQKQYYFSDNSPIIVTEYTNTTLQLVVKSTDFVLPGQDAFVRKFNLKWNDTTLIKNAKLIFTSNMAPCNKNPNFDPSQDWVADQYNGFANAFYSPKNLFVSFIPHASVANAALLPNIFSTQNTIDNFVTNLDVTFPSLTNNYNPINLVSVKDIYCVIGANKPAISHGMLSDYGYAQAMPDSLIPNGQSISAGAAMLYNFYNINLSNTNKADSILFQFTLGPTYNLAQNLYDSVFSVNYNSLFNTTLNFWNNKLSTAQIPATGDSNNQKVLSRILVNTLLGINRGVGALGSSVCSSQPAYSQLWPRDNAAMAYMLDCAGYHAEAEAAIKFFAIHQRITNGQDCQSPTNNECYAGTWSQCYYANGQPGWAYDFEIDEVGWTIWELYEHSNFLTGTAKINYLSSVYPNIKRGAVFLKNFKDVTTGLQLLSREDDVPWQAQTIYGASTTLMGLKAAYSAALFMGDSIQVLQGFTTRISELENAIQTYKWGLQGNQYDYKVYGNFGPRAMIIWPALLKDSLNTQMLSHADSLYNQIEPFFSKSNASLNVEWWYVGRTLTALAYLWRNNPAKRAIVENCLNIVLKQVPTKGTNSYGETVMVRDFDSAGITIRRYDNRVGQPSNYPATWFYLTAEMLFGKPNNNLYAALEPTVVCISSPLIELTSDKTGTVYQWQVLDSTLGFININNNSFYNNTNNVKLQLSNIPSYFNGKKYRCLVDGNNSKIFEIKFKNIWTNAVNNNWENPANWSCFSVPDEYSDVEINFGTVLVNSNVKIRTLLINPSVSFTVLQPFNFLITH